MLAIDFKKLTQQTLVFFHREIFVRDRNKGGAGWTEGCGERPVGKGGGRQVFIVRLLPDRNLCRNAAAEENLQKRHNSGTRTICSFAFLAKKVCRSQFQISNFSIVSTQDVDKLYWDHGKQWHRAAYNVSEQDGEFFLSFETVSSLYGSDAGIDDVRLDDGPCNSTGRSTFLNS